ncbi:MAG: prepilin peptidase [Humibacter sp.]
MTSPVLRPIAAPPRLVRRLAWQAPVAAALATLSVAVLGWRFELVGFLYLALVTPELCRVDLAEHRLPNVLVVPGIVVAAVGVVLGALAEWQVPAAAVGSTVVVCGFFALLAVAGGLGMGDVKLSAALAVAGGGVSTMIVIGTVVLGFFAAGAAALGTVVVRGGGGSIAFGPYLLGGFWASLGVLPLVG